MKTIGEEHMEIGESIIETCLSQLQQLMVSGKWGDGIADEIETSQPTSWYMTQNEEHIEGA